MQLDFINSSLKNEKVVLLISLLFFPTFAYARGSLGLPSSLNAWAVILLLPIAFLSWRDLKIVSILSIAILLSILTRSFEPLGYTTAAIIVFLIGFAAILYPITIYYRIKENKRIEEIAKSEVKWVRTQDGIQKIGSVIFYNNKHFEIQLGKKKGIKLIYPKKMFIFAEEVENFDSF